MLGPLSAFETISLFTKTQLSYVAALVDLLSTVVIHLERVYKV